MYFSLFLMRDDVWTWSMVYYNLQFMVYLKNLMQIYTRMNMFLEKMTYNVFYILFYYSHYTLHSSPLHLSLVPPNICFIKWSYLQEYWTTPLNYPPWLNITQISQLLQKTSENIIIAHKYMKSSHYRIENFRSKFV